ncbi:MAG TPA: AsmA family protein, partial [Flavisolibacter sp.]|nr:AsmA family protein [Flavisolibacter sp.]
MQEETNREEQKTTVKKKRSLPAKIGRIFLKTLLFLILFIILIFLLILTPPVQRFLTGKVENFLEKKLQTNVEIGRIAFGLSGDVSLKNVYIEDRTKDTLVSGGAIKANINFLKLLSSELEVTGIELQNITAKIKRVLPDTTFNYQFVVDAFVSKTPEPVDTAAIPMKMSISDVTLDNVALTYKDVVTGNDVFARIGYATTTIDTLDPYTQTFTFPSLILRNSVVRMKQTKPLLEPKPLSVDLKEAATPAPMHLSFGVLDVSKVAIQYDNDVSALYSNISIGKLKVDGKLLDLSNNKIHLDEIALANTTASIRLGKKQGATVLKEQAAQEVQAQAIVPWDFKVDRVRFDNSTIQFDDDAAARLTAGMDYSHLKMDSLTLHADNIVYNKDGTGL